MMYTVFVLKVLDENLIIKKWRLRVSKKGWTGFFSQWPSDLWSRPYDKIISFLLERRKNTTNPSEYYMTLPYLSNDVDSAILDQTFESFHWGTSNHTNSEKSTYLDTQMYPVETYLNTI